MNDPLRPPVTRDRVVGLRRVRAGDLIPNPKNWRRHPKGQQDAMRGMLAEIGWADALIAREQEDGSLLLLDGHLRSEVAPDDIVPVLVVDLDEREGDKLLATLDPLAAMADRDGAAIRELLSGIEADDERVKQLLATLSEDEWAKNADIEAALTPEATALRAVIKVECEERFAEDVLLLVRAAVEGVDGVSVRKG